MRVMLLMISVCLFSCTSGNVVHQDKEVNTRSWIDSAVTKVGISESDEKCNYFKSYYILKDQSLTDTSKLYDVVKMLCKIDFGTVNGLDTSSLRYQYREHNINCTLPVMIMTYLYINEHDYNEHQALASCLITPDHPDGSVVIGFSVLQKNVKQ